jgi:polyhydroxyalkanoate synthesis regulator phasin
LNQKQQEMLEQRRMTFQALQQQREGALKELERKVSSLLESTSEFVAPVLRTDNRKSDDGVHAGHVLSNGLRGLVAAVNSAQLTLSAHDQFVDMIIEDLGACVQNIQMTQKNFMDLSITVKTLVDSLVSKDLLTMEEFAQLYKEIATQAREEMKELENSEK